MMCVAHVPADVIPADVIPAEVIPAEVARRPRWPAGGLRGAGAPSEWGTQNDLPAHGPISLSPDTGAIARRLMSGVVFTCTRPRRIGVTHDKFEFADRRQPGGGPGAPSSGVGALR